MIGMKTEPMITFEKALDISSVRVEYAALRYDFPVHTHAFSELVVITGGKCSHIIDNETYEIQTGDVFVLKGNTAHGFTNVRGVCMYNVIYRADEPVFYYNDLKELPGFQALFFVEPLYRKTDAFQHKLQLDARGIEFAQQLLSRMLAESERPDAGLSHAVHIYFTSLILFLSREYGNSVHRHTSIMQISDTLAYIERNFRKTLTIAELASMAYMSERNFSRLFMKNYHMPPKEYILSLRIRSACERLLHTDKSVTEIAFDSGFNDANYFSRCFKQKTGSTPSEYRRLGRIPAIRR